MSGKRMMAHYATEEKRWRAVIDRDARAAEAFVYAVTSTGIYCRPGCPSRAPLRENARFYDHAAAAEAAGYRACKRCQPDQPADTHPHAEAIATVCRLIESAEQEPTLAELARAVGLSPTYLQRVFKDALGVSPKQYAMERRLQRARENLQEGNGVTEAIYAAGYEASSRFYEQAPDGLGMTPDAFRRGGEGTMIHYALADCALGRVLVAATDKGLCAIMLGDEDAPLVDDLRGRFGQAEVVGPDPALGDWAQRVVTLIDAPGRGLDLPLDVIGTAFQRRVWQALREIPTGQTATYGEIAQRIGQPTASRAVAGACAANKLAVLIPCHRVVRGDGGLGGYHWGLERKRALLEREEETTPQA